ncbi:cobyrinate a,c-diamide synthase [Planomonospora parontospora]|uniref:cobyrinate a,c-diamide synthase n=1 Tax=Planomonospora parontospora TaxID=58119 RepID=UPI0016707966|nr:cobyrinate a,c-diamide synthase [Planomonospora parontospora]GGL17221.1 hydrogenobyrinate a,c-diamide synthase [Planomonospora parontospora subsp. antibiotica]GII15272.1 hydrogenobyrinate a,c-diamide synthase [Planomonospora parontospora subsp. antibiotica]
MSVPAPRLVIAAPASGAGKTTVATGLMAALARRGLAVSPHKVGPDYIDPGYHALATGRPGRNLDPWLVGEELVVPLFLHGAAGSGIAVIEGVMGLYDGAGSGEFASTAHVARLLDAPVVLVVDAARQSRSVAALVHGFASYDTRLRFGGVILNRVGSQRHENLLREALTESGVPVLGAIRRSDAVAVPSRHLGLVTAAEHGSGAAGAMDAAEALVAGSCDLDALVRLARTAPPLPGGPWNPDLAVRTAAPAGSSAARAGAPPAGPGASTAVRGVPDLRGVPHAPDGIRIAVAGGRAFTFGYTEQAELLAAAGAELAVFDPLTDEDLPEGSRGVVIGGGFPEVYADELSANEPLRRRIAAFGGPIAAECAGLLYLARSLDGRPMCGVVGAEAGMTGRLTLGYRDAVAVRDSVLTREGERYRGHEFHRTAVEPAPDRPLFRWRGGADGFADGRVTASYLHLHWAGHPHLAARFAAECARPGDRAAARRVG